MKLDHTRDELLTDFGKATLRDRYLLPGEGYQDMFARVSAAYADDDEHAQRVYDYMSKLWFMPSTPVLSNGGADRGLPISCFLNSAEDSMDGIRDIWNENIDLAKKGGGIGTYWGGVRSIGEPIKGAGQTSGIIPFIRVMDSLTLAVSQGSLRRGSAAVYLDVHHPEIEEFLEIRKPTGDANRKALNIHHGINIPDAFMEAVRNGDSYDLISPRTGDVCKTVDARELWSKILDIRMQTGEPYLIFTDTVNRYMCDYQRKAGLRVKQSNLCAEIMLHTGKDHLGVDRTAVCCLASTNAEKFLEWREDPLFVEDIMRFLDNVLEDFIQNAPPSMKNAVYSAKRERSVGLGVMGFHSFLQSQGVPFESAMARSWNMNIFMNLHEKSGEASKKIALEKGPCEDAAEAGVMERFSHRMAVAPTASISIICGGTSAGIEPIPANIYTHKTLSGSFAVKNPYLEKLLELKGLNTEETWSSILEHEGSVQHLDFLDAEEKAIFKTAFELNQKWIVDLAGDRLHMLCQSQSVNLFLPGDVDKWDLHMLHWKAWEQRVKSLYYLRSKSVQRAAFAGADMVDVTSITTPHMGDDTEGLTFAKTDYEECLSCQ